MVIRDVRGNDVVLYNDHGTLLIPQCATVQEIIVQNTTRCYHDLPVTYIIEDKKYNGFLTQDNILKKTSDIVECATIRDKTYYVSESAKILKQV